MTEHRHGFDYGPNVKFSKCRCGILSKNPYYGTGMNIYSREPIGEATGVHMHAPNQPEPKKWPFRLAVAWLSIVGLRFLAFIVWATLQTPTEQIFSFLRALGTLFLGGAVFVGTALAFAFVYERSLDK